MQKTGTRLGIAGIVLLLAVPLFGQQGESKFGVGAAGVASQLYSDAATTPFGFGGQASLLINLSQRFGFSFSPSFSSVGYLRSATAGTETTSLLALDFAVDTYVLKKSRLQAFISTGAGLLRFSPQNSASGIAAEFFAGPGLRWFFSEKLAFSVSGVAKYTTSDELDQIINSGSDMYFTFRAGIDYFQPSREKSIHEELEITEIDLLDENEPALEPDTAEELFARMDSLESEPTPPEDPVSETKPEQDLFPAEESPELHDDEEAAADPAMPTRDAEPEPETPPQQRQRISPQEYNERYDRGLMDFQKRNYRKAIENFRFLSEADPGNALASNCWYWIGESYFGLKEYAKAAEFFSRVFEYEKSWKHDDALLMLGRSAIKLGNYRQAREWLIRLLENYPASEYAAKAEYYLGVGTIAE